jgi:hypothetical protein
MASKPGGRTLGAIARQMTDSLAYVAPTARVSANAFALWPPLKRAGSAIAVASGAVPGVVLRRLDAPADAVTAASESAATATAAQRRTTTRSRSS